MIVRNGDTANVATSSLERSHQSHEITSAPEIPTKISVPVTDQIALSLATKFLQHATNAGENVQLEDPTTEDGHLKEQYQYDPLVVGRALIEAHLRGE